MMIRLATGGAAPNGYFRSIVQDHTKLGSSDLTNFPVLLSVTDASLKSQSNGGNVHRTDGLDIWVSTTSTGVTKVPFELLYYVPTTGQLILWILGSSISHTGDTTIGYLRYGDSSITTDQSNKAGTWVSYRSVAHCTTGNSLSLSGTDATGNAIEYVNQGSPTTGTGKILQGVTLATSNGFAQHTALHPIFPNGTITAFSYSFWWNPATTPSTSTVDNIMNGDAISFAWGHNNATYRQAATIRDGGGSFLAAKLTTTFSAGTYYLITYEWDGTNLRAYTNGVLEATTAVASIGSTGGATLLSNEGGVMEEIRGNLTVFGADWALSRYHNENAPGSFTTLGTETAV